MALSNKDLTAVAQWIVSELQRRKALRNDRERIWKEIDRQIAMIPAYREIKSGTKPDWYPDLEPPLQFNALEVIAADARRLKFPPGTEWYAVSAEISEEYNRRWGARRDRIGMIGDQPVPMKLDPETANLMIKTTMDHFHRLYDFRASIDLFDSEMIKYGTGVVRVRPTKLSKFGGDFRGRANENVVGPAVIPCSIKNTYLDDSPSAVLHEGLATSPGFIRTGSQLLDDLKRASRDPDRGWLPGQVRELKPKDDRKHVDIFEFEGDLVVPKSQGSIFLPNVLIKVAHGAGDPRVIRLQETTKSYVVGHYMRDDVKSPYGSSPLVKGQPIQEAIALVFNDLLAASRLSTLPPLAYDRNDPNLVGGPEIYPGAQFGTDAPNSIEALGIGDIAAQTNAYLALVKQYEDLTGANDPRRGAPIKSHTTATGNELEVSRGLSRTDDFVTATEQGALTTILYMEYGIIKKNLKRMAVPVGKSGVEGWINVGGQDLADNVEFFVQGSAGVINERERASNFIGATQFALQVAQVAAALGKPVDLNFMEIIEEGYERAGVTRARRFIGASASVPGATAVGPGVQGNGTGPETDFRAAIQALGVR